MKSNLSRSGKQRFWEEHFAGWESSGVSQVEYCRSHKISLRSFQYFHRKSKRSAAELVELRLPANFSVPVSPPGPQLCLVIDRYRVEIGKRFDEEDLERLMRVLGRI